MNRRFPLCVLLIVLVSLINSLLAAARKIFSSAYICFRDNVITVKPWYLGYAARPNPPVRETRRAMEAESFRIDSAHARPVRMSSLPPGTVLHFNVANHRQ